MISPLLVKVCKDKNDDVMLLQGADISRSNFENLSNHEKNSQGENDEIDILSDNETLLLDDMIEQ